MPSASAFVFLLRPRTLPWSILLCSRAARIGNLQLVLVCGRVKSSNNVVLFSSEHVQMLSLLQLVLLMHFVLLCYVEAGTTGMKKELKKVVLRQSVMNWVEDGAEDFVALGSCGPCTGRDR